MWGFLKKDCLLTKGFTQNFKERYYHKRGESQGSNLENCLPKEAPQEKSPKSLNANNERLYGRIFLTEFGETFLQAFFKVSFFLRLRRKHTSKNPIETQSMKIQVKSGEIHSARTLEKLCKA